MPKARVSDQQMLRQGDVLIATSSGSLDVVGKAAPVASDLGMAFGAFCKVLRPRTAIEPRYFAHYFRTTEYRRLVSALAGGVNINNLRKEHLDNLLLPVPDWREQRRIAGILDKADAIRRKRREAIALTDELLRSAFLEMFGDPVTNPKGWPVLPLGEAIDRIEAGLSANGEQRRRNPDEFGVLKVSAVTSGIFAPSEHKAVPQATIDRELVTPRAGDLLFSRANTRELVGATCLVDEDQPRLFLPDKLWRIVPRTNVAVTPFLRFLLSDGRLRRELTKTATGTSGSMLNVSMDKLRSLRGPIPPVELQERFGALVEKSSVHKRRNRSASEAASDLFASLAATHL